MTWIKEEKLYPVLILILIFIMAVRMPVDSDMWWHLRAGEETLKAGQVYRIDTFSSSRYGENWINHSWLSQVFMALLMRIGNLPALSIWVAVFAVVSMGFVYLQMEGHPLIRSAVLILTAMVNSVVWSPRPQIMSLILLSLLTLLMYIYRKERNWKVLVGVTLIFPLWGNLHAGYVLGLIYLGAFLGGEILDKIGIRNIKEGLSWKEIGSVASAMVLGFVLVLINPFGLEMWKIPFNTVGVETLQNMINEWASPDFHQLFQQPLLWMLLGLLGVLGIGGKSLRGYRLVPVVLFAWAALVARRNFGPFGIVAAPALAGGLSAVFKEWIDQARESLLWFRRFLESAKKNNKEFNPLARNIINVILIGLLLLAGGIKTIRVNQPDLIAQAERELFPVGAAKWIEAQREPIKIFNDYNWGGYLIYHLPEFPVFVDGRTDLYGDEILGDYIEVISGNGNWQEILTDYSLDTLIIKEDSRLKDLALAEGWRVLYQDQTTIVMQDR